MPSLWAWPRRKEGFVNFPQVWGFGPPHGHAHVNDTHSLRASSGLYTFTRGFLHFPQRVYFALQFQKQRVQNSRLTEQEAETSNLQLHIERVEVEVHWDSNLLKPSPTMYFLQQDFTFEELLNLPQTALLIGDQGMKYLSLWGTFFMETTRVIHP